MTVFPRREQGRSDSHRCFLLPAGLWLLTCVLRTRDTTLSLSLIFTRYRGQACLVGPVFPLWSQRIFLEVYGFYERQHLAKPQSAAGSLPALALPGCSKPVTALLCRAAGRGPSNAASLQERGSALLGPSFVGVWGWHSVELAPAGMGLDCPAGWLPPVRPGSLV